MKTCNGKKLIRQCDTYCVRIAEVKSIMENSNSAMRHCVRIAEVKWKSNTAMRRARAHRRPIENLIRQFAVLTGALSPLKIIWGLSSPRLEIRSVAAEPSHGPGFCGSLYHSAPHSAYSPLFYLVLLVYCFY